MQNGQPPSREPSLQETQQTQQNQPNFYDDTRFGPLPDRFSGLSLDHGSWAGPPELQHLNYSNRDPLMGSDHGHSPFFYHHYDHHSDIVLQPDLLLEDQFPSPMPSERHHQLGNQIQAHHTPSQHSQKSQKSQKVALLPPTNGPISGSQKRAGPRRARASRPPSYVGPGATNIVPADPNAPNKVDMDAARLRREKRRDGATRPVVHLPPGMNRQDAKSASGPRISPPRNLQTQQREHHQSQKRRPPQSHSSSRSAHQSSSASSSSSSAPASYPRDIHPVVAAAAAAANMGPSIRRLETPSVVQSVLQPLGAKVDEYGNLMAEAKVRLDHLEEELRELENRRREAEQYYLDMANKHEDYQRQYHDVEGLLRGEMPASAGGSTHILPRRTQSSSRRDHQPYPPLVPLPPAVPEVGDHELASSNSTRSQGTHRSQGTRNLGEGEKEMYYDQTSQPLLRMDSIDRKYFGNTSRNSATGKVGGWI